ncbi:MAG: methyltransferase domain-containing protein [Pseudonocardiales bacterium]|nr:methyltransferase domain-containing protein [Pseudonocardiales bacterium]
MVTAVREGEWSWDPSLYGGSAAYYARGRVPYPDAVADSLAAALRLDSSGRLLDVGCGPGSLTLLLAPMVAEATGIDADRDMLSEAARLAADTGVRNVSWRHLRAEDLPAGLGTYRLVTFARSFHWMDRPRVAAAVHRMLDRDGACVHVHAATHQGADTGQVLLHPQPPRSDIAELVHRYLGPTRRAGRGRLPQGRPTDADSVYRAAGFAGPHRIEVPGRAVTRAADDVVAAVFSRSSSAPHLFGDQRTAFVTELRQLLRDASPTGLFSQPVREIALDIWRP